ncbi:MAG TPA: NUDIX domain-containing protein [Croceibacterium sp.]|nr:NUDIX domain-containing protein [Croceibacterium sp.]
MASFSHCAANESLMRSVNVENSPTFLLVVAAAVMDADGRLLLQQALPGKRHSGQWEFPGGKVESLESPRLALCREVREELGLELEEMGLQPASFAEEAPQPGRPGIVLMLYRSATWSGNPESREGQQWAWFTAEEAASLPLAAMDRVLLQKLLNQGAEGYCQA